MIVSDRSEQLLPAAVAHAAPGIEVSGLSKRFAQVEALRLVNLTVPTGGVTAVVGRNGAGKSTLIKVLSTTVLPDEGTALVCGHDVVDASLDVRRCIGLALGDDRSFFWRLTGRQNIEFFARLYGAGRTEVSRRTEAALAAVELLEVADRRVDRYSTGMRSRLGLARALLAAPQVLLLDEPTRSLDPAAADSVRELVREFVKRTGTCVLLATHDLEEAATLATEVVVMRQGHVAARRHPPYDIDDLRDCIRGER